MLKQKAIKKIYISTLALIILLLICIFPSNKDINEEIVYLPNKELPIYAIDPNGYVVRTNIIDKTDKSLSNIEFIIDVLTIGSVNNLVLTNGFVGVIPKGTALLNYETENNTLKLNFSNEFLNIEKENEEKLIESLVYSLCEIKNIDNISIYVEDQLLDKLPNSKKSLNSKLDKSYGINKIFDVSDIKNTSKTTIYYLEKINSNEYYVPITKINNSNKEAVEIIIEELQNKPIYESNLISYLNVAYELQDYEILENSIKLSFDNKALANLKDSEITEKVKFSLSLSLRDTYLIDDITILFN